jgi:4-amino-4-deoxy-L-arabinose transferase-like glycosyltransferase
VPGRDLAILTVVFLAVQLPFLGQALVIDDGNFVDQALQILRDPTAPYSFTIHLDRPLDFFSYFANPPGLAYYLAGGIGLFGRSEVALHSLCLLFPGLAVLAMYALAREVTGHGLFAALLLLVTPAFLISSHTVMADVPAAAFYLLAVWLYVRGVDEDRTTSLLLSGVAAGVAALLKYSGITVLPLMLLYALLRGRLRVATLSPLLIAAGLFGAWCLASHQIYGQVHVAAAFSLEATARNAVRRLVQGVAAVTGAGGATIFPPLLLVWAIASSRALSRRGAWVAFAAAVAAFLAALPPYDMRTLSYDLPNRILGGLLFSAGVAAVAFVLLCGLDALRGIRSSAAGTEKRQAALTLLLVAWFLGFLLIDSMVLFATPKYLVPALAPLLLLLIGASAPTRAAFAAVGRWQRAAILGSTAALALALSVVSAAQGADHRRFVTELVPELAADRPAWFNGHWTVRYYAEHAGHRYLGPDLTPDANPAPGDLVFVVLEAVWHRLPDPLIPRLELVETRFSPAPLPVHLANQLVSAGYWSHNLGVMPYVISTQPLSVFSALRVKGG